MADSAIPLSATVVAASDVLATELGNEHVLLNLKNGTYYGFEEVGGEIWKLLQQPITVTEICRAIESMFDVEPERCRQDVTRLITELAEHHLVERRT